MINWLIPICISKVCCRRSESWLTAWAMSRRFFLSIRKKRRCRNTPSPLTNQLIFWQVSRTDLTYTTHLINDRWIITTFLVATERLNNNWSVGPFVRRSVTLSLLCQRGATCGVRVFGLIIHRPIYRHVRTYLVLPTFSGHCVVVIVHFPIIRELRRCQGEAS